MEQNAAEEAEREWGEQIMDLDKGAKVINAMLQARNASKEYIRLIKLERRRKQHRAYQVSNQFKLHSSPCCSKLSDPNIHAWFSCTISGQVKAGQGGAPPGYPWPDGHVPWGHGTADGRATGPMRRTSGRSGSGGRRNRRGSSC
jgi:hypothetical protein